MNVSLNKSIKKENLPENCPLDLTLKINTYYLVEDITWWLKVMILMFEPACNVFIIIYSCFDKGCPTKA